ncbi:Crp/Fnr family transcriptional regulator [Paraburkholderia sp. MMS20-SJTR3]|uniref:Crp/Fnr family transcriptional regulator n=1 Tax=Paraburkholderia sejongensis TaxID=2886946 RepID=A0ABS8K3T4_9BURK|nr:Crp/Fnr family transcriptional regulator [Paraburkholderia sp. MMS20-SJTR3]MCC8396818.1 Crp/Fnr family transcriptional regulator [Paraburkholderia sp. MMS20-SJTR3]
MSCLDRDLCSNHFLGALAEEDLRALKPHLELVRVKSSQLLCDADAPATHLYFPTTAVISLLYLMEDGAIVEVASIGKEGLVGQETLTGGGNTPGRVEVRCGGLAYRIAANAMRNESEKSLGIYRAMVSYMQALMTQIAQSALCTRHHSIRQQLCRWLLVAHDQLDSDELTVTQQMIANMLGVRREGVTDAAGQLQEAGLILQRRGRINVLDRQGLEERACECYSMIRREFDRLLPHLDEDVSAEEVLQVSPSGRPLRSHSRAAFSRSV